MNDDELIHDERLKEYLLEAFPNPERKGCPSEQSLQAAAEDRLQPGDPARRHVASCSECYGDYLNFRQDWLESKQQERAAAAWKKPAASAEVVATETRKSRFLLEYALAACALITAGVSFVVYKHHSAPTQLAQSVPVTAKVDLFNAITVRGVETEPVPLERVLLPAQVVQLSITLPRFSRAGEYSIVVAKDRAGSQLVAEGHGNTVESDGKVVVNASLDLRNAKPGDYFLATVRGSDNGTYYYPLQVH